MSRRRARSSGERQDDFDIELQDDSERLRVLDAQRQRQIDELLREAANARRGASAGNRFEWTPEEIDQGFAKAANLEDQAAQIRSQMGWMPEISMPARRLSMRRSASRSRARVLAAQSRSGRGIQCTIPRDPRTGRFISRRY